MKDFAPKTWTLIDFRFLIACIPFAISFLYLHPLVDSFTTELIRASFIIVMAIFLLGLSLVTEIIPKLPWPWYLAPPILAVVMIFSSLFSANVMTSLFGVSGDYQGLFTQLGSMVIGLFAAAMILKADWLLIARVAAIICAVSIVVDLGYLLSGYRLAGLFMHATGMSLFAVVSLGLNLLAYSSNRNWPVFGMAASTLAVVLTASRVGVFAAIITIFLVACLLPKLRFTSLMLVVVLGVLLAGYSHTSMSHRLISSKSISEGFGYRLELAAWGIENAKTELIGRGASQTYTALSPPQIKPVPPNLQRSIDEGYPLWYTHNQFLDIYIQYGLAGLSLFMILIVGAIVQALKMAISKNRDLKWLIILFPILLHLLVNTPSLELMPLVYFSLFGSLFNGTKSRKVGSIYSSC